MYFHIPNNVYSSYEAQLEEREFQKLFSDESVTQNVGIGLLLLEYWLTVLYLDSRLL